MSSELSAFDFPASPSADSAIALPSVDVVLTESGQLSKAGPVDEIEAVKETEEMHHG
ncbi:hypothetical protein HDU93_006748, partial [Gonapodya sp. JEL0774]